MAAPDVPDEFPELPSRRWDGPVNPPRRMPFRFDPGISLGHVLSALPTIVLAVWILSGNAKQTDANQKQLDQYHTEAIALSEANKKQQDQSRAEVTSQINNVKSDLLLKIADMRTEQANQIAQIQLNTNKQFDNLALIIANLPGMNVRVDQLEKRVDNVQRQQEQDHSAVIENTANINNIGRQVNILQKIR